MVDFGLEHVYGFDSTMAAFALEHVHGLASTITEVAFMKRDTEFVCLSL